VKPLLPIIAALCLLTGCVRAARHVVDSFFTPAVVVVSDDAAAVPAGLSDDLVKAVKDGDAGVTAIVMRNGKLLYRLDAGKIDPQAQYPAASSSKWMTAALVMTVVDEGKLSLDTPISTWLPEFQGAAGTITLRELLAQTAGQGSLKGLVDVKQDPRMTLGQSAAEIAALPLQDKPGKVFKYGGPGFQVAGALVEKVTGERWSKLFDERIAKPLGMYHTYWQHLPDRGVSLEDTLNPLLQGGVVTTAEDYMRFLTMLADGGEYQGRRILSAASVETMETAQTLGKPMDYLPPGSKSDHDLQYALGNWCERWNEDGHCTLVSSPGAFGAYPWIDHQSGLYGIFFTRSRLPKVAADFVNARAAMLAALKDAGDGAQASGVQVRRTGR
jgi:CubicO group peptidase (beta-lactamase class C family)